MANKTPAEAAAFIDSIVGDLEFTEADLLELGHAGVTMVLARTKEGLDADLKPFAPYSKSYEVERLYSGLSKQRDLVRTGHTLGAMLPTVTAKDEVTVHFASAESEEIASYQNYGTSTVPKSEFMDIRADKELEFLAEAGMGAIIARVEKKIK